MGEGSFQVLSGFLFPQRDPQPPQRLPPPAHPNQPRKRLKCHDLQLGPLSRPSWVPARDREAVRRLGERGKGCPLQLGPSVPRPRRGGGQVTSKAAPEHLQGCLQETSNSGTEAPTQESFPPPSPSLPTLLLGLICTDLPRRLLADLPCPWQGFDRGGGAGARRGADGGEPAMGRVVGRGVGQQEPGLPKAVQT